MNSIFRTKGIVLRRRNIGETDRILTIYTENYGKLSALARGVRRTTSKLAGHLEILVESNLHLVQGKSYLIITSAEEKTRFKTIGKLLPQTSTAYYLADLICLLTQDEVPQKEVYNLLFKGLKLLETKDHRLLTPAFTINLLTLLGFRPELYQCVVSGEKLSPERLRFSYSQGGLIDNHVKSMPDVKMINIQTVKLLRIATGNFELIYRLKIEPEIMTEFIDVVTDYSLHIIQKLPKSTNFFKEMHANVG